MNGSEATIKPTVPIVKSDEALILAGAVCAIAEFPIEGGAPIKFKMLSD